MLTIRSLAAALGATALLAGCGMSAESFVKDYAKVSCQAYEHCSRASFVDAFDDQEECREETEEYLDDLDVVDDCDFDEEKARKCIETLREFKASCDPDDYDYEDCYETFDDCDGGGGGGGGGFGGGGGGGGGGGYAPSYSYSSY